MTTDLAKALGVKGASIRLLDETEETLELVASCGLSEKYLQKGPVSAQKSIAQALNERKPVIILNAATDKRVQYRNMNQEEGIVTILSVPIKTKEKVIGVLRLYSEVVRHFTAGGDHAGHRPGLSGGPGHPECLPVSDVPDGYEGPARGVVEPPLLVLGGAGGQLITDLEALRQRLEQMEKSQDKCQKAEEALQDEHKLSSALLDTVGALVVVLDREGRIIRFNRACEESTGYTFAEVKNKPFWDIFLTPGEKDGVKAVFHRLLSGDLPNTHENYWVTKKGDLRLISWSNTAVVKDGQVELIIGTGIDMTEREKVEKYITHLATFPQLSPSPILEIDLSGRITFYNAATLKTLERLGSPGHVEAFLPEDFEEIVQEANKTGESYHQREVQVGSSIFIETISFLADLNVARIYASDITERKQAEGALRRIKASLAEAQRIAHLGNWEWDIARNELTWTDEIYRIFGLTPQEFRPTHDNFLSFIYPDDLMAVKNQLEEGINSGKYGPYDYRIVRRDGSIRLVYAQGETYFDQEGRPLRMVGTVQDITERKKAEEDRLQFSKLESLSILAGGVAHDFNNLLTTILLNIDLAMLNRRLDEKVIERLVRAEEACFRAKELSGKLLTFAKGGKPLKTVMSLSKLVRESGQLALAGSKSRCRIFNP